ncbi:MAG: hypothetical protein ACI93R_000592 [Flavobacteriales bacterium]|jgi:uncharacterized protein (DUF1499 family)
MEWSRTLLQVELIVIALMVLCVAGHKFGVLPFKLAFGAFALALLLTVLLSLAAFVMIFIWMSIGGFKANAIAFAVPIVVGLLPVIVILSVLGAGRKAPRIHDISTRQDPIMEFQAAQALRKSSENSLKPANARVLAAQYDYYHNVSTLVLKHESHKVFQQIFTLVSDHGWRLSHVDEQAMNIEAVAETRLFGFKDDILIEVRELEGAVHVDMRSVSRVGVSDLGANAKRIEMFLLELGRALEG